jgi:hypothetical protein
MSELSRWTGAVDLGAFRFKADGGPLRSLTLRNDGPRMVDEGGRDFCTPEELQAVPSLAWRGLPAIVVEEEDGPGLYVVWPDARGIGDPDTFRARMLGVDP